MHSAGTTPPRSVWTVWAHTEVKNFTVFFENEQVVRWEGDYFPSQDEQLAKAAPKQFGRNLARDKKKQRGR